MRGHEDEIASLAFGSGDDPVMGGVTLAAQGRGRNPRIGRRLCRAEACQSMTGRALEQHAMKRLGIGFGETTADGAVTLEAVYCLGLCACSPAAMIGEEVHGRVTPERLDELLSVAGPGK